MIVDVRERLDARPFVPFTIHVADGREYRGATPDHAHVHRNRARVSVFADDGREIILPALLISGIAVDVEQVQRFRQQRDEIHCTGLILLNESDQ